MVGQLVTHVHKYVGATLPRASDWNMPAGSLTAEHLFSSDVEALLSRLHEYMAARQTCLPPQTLTADYWRTVATSSAFSTLRSTAIEFIKLLHQQPSRDEIDEYKARMKAADN